MRKEKKMSKLRQILLIATVLLFIITVVLQFVAFGTLGYIIMCYNVLVFLIFIVILDGILSDSASVFTHIFWCEMWFVYMILNLSKV